MLGEILALLILFSLIIYYKIEIEIICPTYGLNKERRSMGKKRRNLTKKDKVDIGIMYYTSTKENPITLRTIAETFDISEGTAWYHVNNFRKSEMFDPETMHHYVSDPAERLQKARANILSSKEITPSLSDENISYLKLFGIDSFSFTACNEANFESVSFESMDNIDLFIKNFSRNSKKKLLINIDVDDIEVQDIIDITAASYNYSVDSCIRYKDGINYIVRGNDEYITAPSIFNKMNKDYYADGIYLYDFRAKDLNNIENGYIIKLVRCNTIVERNGIIDNKFRGSMILIKSYNNVWNIYSAIVKYVMEYYPKNTEKTIDISLCSFSINDGNISIDRKLANTHD